MLEEIIKVFSNSIFLTVFSGTLVYVISQMILELIILPNKEYKLVKAKIAYNLTMYAQYYSNPIDIRRSSDNVISIYREASNEMRKIGSELSGYISNIRTNSRKKNKLETVQKDLIGLSNGFIRISDIDCVINDNIKYVQEIEKLLKIDI